MKTFIGAPCKHGHNGERYINTKRCVSCHRSKEQARYDLIKERKREYDRNYYKLNSTKLIANTKAWRQANPDQRKLQSRMDAANRRIRKRQSANLLNDESKAEMKSIYLNCPPQMEVDHIIPLNGGTVCGLHVPWNLQYLTVKENNLKSNKLILS